MSSPGGRIEIRVDPDLTGFSSKLGSDLESSAKSGVARFASTAKVAITAAAVGIGAAAVLAAKSTLKIGVDYQNQLNTLQAVSGATEAQMRSVGQTAKALGQDMTLPATSAADAAAVMTELAKASFSVADAQAAAKGSLQLAAAAQIDGASAATIQANALLAFNLKASDASHVADVLANSANASSAEITDMADALQQAGAVASAAHISLEDTAAALGILANNGIKGSDAGTLLKSALLALRDTSQPAQKAMKALGLTVYDTRGNFVGLESIFGQLADAQGRMSQQAFEAATNTLFGSDASRLAGVAAKTGAQGFETMRAAMSKQGSAAEVAAAKSKGLGGAIEAFKSQVETFQIDLFERASPNIEKLVRYAAAEFPKVGDAAIGGIEKAVDFFHDLGVEARDDLTAVARYLSPVTSEIDDLWQSITQANGPAQTFWHILQGGGHILLDVTKAAHPLVEAGGELLHFFNSLPGPMQTVILGLAALKIATSVDLFGKIGASEGRVATSLTRVGTGLRGAGQNVVGFGQTVRANMSLAGNEVGGLEKVAGGLSAGFQSYFPKASTAVSTFTSSVKASFAEAKRDARFDIADQFGMSVRDLPKAAGDARGAVSGLGTALKGLATGGMNLAQKAGSSLVNFLGGPWGVALAAASVIVGEFAAHSQEMAQAEAQARTAGANLGATYRELGGVFGAAADQARQMALEESGLLDSFKESGVSIGTQIDALEGNKKAQDAVVESMKRLEAKNFAKDPTNLARAWDALTGTYGKNTQAAKTLFEQLQASTSPFLIFATHISDADSAVAAYEQDARKVFGDDTISANVSTLARAMGDLASASGDAVKQTDAIRRILDILSGNAPSAQQVLADTTQAIADMGHAFEGVEPGAVTAAGALDLNTEAGASLYGRLKDLASQYKDVVTETYNSVAATDGQAAAADAAGKKATDLYNGFILSATGAGINRDQADQLAKSLGLVPGEVVTQFLQPGMTESQVAADVLKDKVIGVPDSKTIHTQALTADAMQALEAVGFTVRTLPDGTMDVTANTAAARAAISSLISNYQNYPINLVAHVVGGGLAVGRSSFAAAGGGLIRGAGTETSDSIAGWLSDYEYVTRAKIVRQAGVDTMHAFNAGDWRAVLPRIQELAAQQAGSSLAAVTAGRKIGGYAAGGLITAQNRAAAFMPAGQAQPVATVPTSVIGAAFYGPVYSDPAENARRAKRGTQRALAAAGLGR